MKTGPSCSHVPAEGTACADCPGSSTDWTRCACSSRPGARCGEREARVPGVPQARASSEGAGIDTRSRHRRPRRRTRRRGLLVDHFPPTGRLRALPTSSRRCGCRGRVARPSRRHRGSESSRPRVARPEPQSVAVQATSVGPMPQTAAEPHETDGALLSTMNVYGPTVVQLAGSPAHTLAASRAFAVSTPRGSWSERNARPRVREPRESEAVQFTSDVVAYRRWVRYRAAKVGACASATFTVKIWEALNTRGHSRRTTTSVALCSPQSRRSTSVYSGVTFAL